MKLPISWLREFVDVPEDPARVGEALTMVGFALEGLEGEGDDAVLDLDVTTNRVDAMNVYGLAREVAVIYGRPLKPLDLGFTETGDDASRALDVTIEAPDLCPRFAARVLEVRPGPSPDWLQTRLEQVGVRPINVVVDLSNYVMLEMGHPTHAFDLARIPSGRLTVRWAREVEELQTLDGIDRKLTSGIGVVAGPDGALALAGIMGGASSEVSEDTRIIALEAAYWDPLTIRRGARALGMHTEASHRFERGADPEGPPAATARIAHLVEKLGVGSTRPGLIDVVPKPLSRRTVGFRAGRASAILGTEVPPERCEEILAGLGFDLEKRAAGEWTATVPTWRGDVGREADVVEEVGRHIGLDRIPSTIPASLGVGHLGAGQVEERVVRDLLVGAGLDETITYAFVEGAGEPDVVPVRLSNPLTDQQSVLRTSLVAPGLLDALEANVRQGRRDVALFELGRVFLPGKPLPIEERRLAILLAGAARPAHWSENAREVDVFDLKGLLELVFEGMGLGEVELDPEGPRPELLHPRQSGAIVLDGTPVGWMGVLRPGVRQGRETVVVAEISLDPVIAGAARVARFEALPRFPAIERDLSVIVGAAATARDVVGTVRRAAGDLLRRVEVKDRYDRPPVPAGKVSLMLSLRYQHPERTLTSDEVQASVEAVIRELRGAGVDIRDKYGE
jgi:phenylalanyl-tRNA synthetase beta chain